MAFPALLGTLLPVLAPLLDKVIEKAVPDPAAREQAQAALRGSLIDNAHQLEQAAAEVVKTEAASRHWLAANWRPLTMLVFVALIVARWMGWSAAGMTEAEYIAVYDLIQLGLGGYVIGRSAEKMLPAIAEAMRTRK